MTDKYVKSSSDNRTVNNTFRQKYRVLSDTEKKLMDDIKDCAAELENYLNQVTNLLNDREIALARTKLEEAVMWGIKGLTK